MNFTVKELDIKQDLLLRLLSGILLIFLKTFDCNVNEIPCLSQFALPKIGSFEFTFEMYFGNVTNILRASVVAPYLFNQSPPIICFKGTSDSSLEHFWSKAVLYAKGFLQLRWGFCFTLQSSDGFWTTNQLTQWKEGVHFKKTDTSLVSTNMGNATIVQIDLKCFRNARSHNLEAPFRLLFSTSMNIFPFRFLTW